MFSSSTTLNGILEQAGSESFCGAAQPRKKNRSRRPATDRATLGATDAAAQRDRGRSGIVSPNSRKSRLPRRSSSHSQGRDGSTMPDSLLTWIGIDVAKDSLDVAYTSAMGIERRSVANSRDGHGSLIEQLPVPATARVVVE